MTASKSLDASAVRRTDAQFAIDVSSRSNLVRIEMGGFFSEADVGAFRATLESKLAGLSCAPNDHLTLCDVTQMKIQPQEIVGAFSKVVGDPKFRSRRLAFITGTSLSRLQTRRLTDRAGVEFFGTAADAESWLLA